MPSYAASARITVTAPRLRFASARRSEETSSGRDEMATAGNAVAVTRLELLYDEDDGFDAWLDRMREAWGQTTWYLFNAEGWR
jgi:hypothetical protein